MPTETERVPKEAREFKVEETEPGISELSGLSPEEVELFERVNNNFQHYKVLYNTKYSKEERDTFFEEYHRIGKQIAKAISRTKIITGLTNSYELIGLSGLPYKEGFSRRERRDLKNKQKKFKSLPPEEQQKGLEVLKKLENFVKPKIKETK